MSIRRSINREAKSMLIFLLKSLDFQRQHIPNLTFSPTSEYTFCIALMVLWDVAAVLIRPANAALVHSLSDPRAFMTRLLGPLRIGSFHGPSVSSIHIQTFSCR